MLKLSLIGCLVYKRHVVNFSRILWLNIKISTMHKFFQQQFRIAQRLVGDAARSGRLVAAQSETLSGLSVWCSFLSCERSGHSLVAALLDAHPEVVLSSEYQILDHFIWGFRREAIAAILIEDVKTLPFNRSRVHGGARNAGYTYSVESQWQGRFRTLRVLGDKNGSGDTHRFARRPWLIGRIEETMQVPVRIVHMYRNPYDVIATIARRNATRSTRPISISEALTEVRALTEIHANMIRQRGPGKIYSLKFETFLNAPQQELRSVLEWLGPTVDQDYLQACAAICFATENITRHKVEWTPKQLSGVALMIEGTPFLRGYTY